MALFESVVTGAIVGLIIKSFDGRETVVPVKVAEAAPGNGGQPIPVTIVGGLPAVIPPDKPTTSLVLYKTLNLSMANARTNYEHKVDGDYLLAWTDGDATDVRFKLNAQPNDEIYMSRLNPIPGPFNIIYISHSAQSGKTLTLHTLRNPVSGFPMPAPSQQVVTATFKPKFSRLRSDKDVNFTGALVTNAKEDESITGLSSNKIVIRRVTFQSDQQLLYTLLFWGTDGFDDTDLDADKFLGEIEIDLPAIGRRVGGANQYYFDLEVEFQYEDEDGTRELHVSLLNRDATAKNAGGTGEVVAEFFYEEAT